MADINFLNSNQSDIQKQHMNAINNKKNAPKGTDPQIFESISEVNRRLKLIETSLTNLRSKVENIENNEIENNKENKRDINSLEQENDGINDQIRDIKENLKLIVGEMQGVAKGEDVEVIKKYLDLWNPVKFVSSDQVKKIARDVFENMMREQAKYQRSSNEIKNRRISQ